MVSSRYTQHSRARSAPLIVLPPTAVFERDLLESEEIEDGALSRRGVLDVLTESAAHLLSPLL